MNNLTSYSEQGTNLACRPGK